MKKRHPMLTLERARILVSYNPENGGFTWISPNTRGKTAGTPAGHLALDSGYVFLGMDGRLYRAHRVAWLLMTGEWPLADVDHINRMRSDNRWVNLRAATRSQNNGNSRSRKKSKTGAKGVEPHHSNPNRFVASIGTNGKKRYLGSYGSIEEASAAYYAAALLQWGEFARIG